MNNISPRPWLRRILIGLVLAGAITAGLVTGLTSQCDLPVFLNNSTRSNGLFHVSLTDLWEELQGQLVLRSQKFMEEVQRLVGGIGQGTAAKEGPGGAPAMKQGH